ncbi:MAG TPA: hypothetical protein VFJ22_01015 [Dermatophilaceae bacterium]|nr:hypothetical protein [Dermatophilaceae bacterium]
MDAIEQGLHDRVLGDTRDLNRVSDDPERQIVSKCATGGIDRSPWVPLTRRSSGSSCYFGSSY